MQTLLATTPLLDYQHPTLQQLVAKRQWNTLAAFDKIQQIYNFVRDEIQFGYNTADNIAASAVLKDGYGQCNTKATLLMALLRAVGIPNRIHGFTIHKALQKGAITGLAYRLSPDDILHSWVEINYNSTWQALEGVILDQSYLTALQKQFTSSKNDTNATIRQLLTAQSEWSIGAINPSEPTISIKTSSEYRQVIFKITANLH